MSFLITSLKYTKNNNTPFTDDDICDEMVTLGETNRRRHGVTMK